MRVLILGGTRFIGRRIAADLVARGDDVTVVHRGETETAEPDGCAHLHTDRAAFAGLAGRVGALRPDAVIDTRAMIKADAEAVLPHLPDAHLVLLSSIDVYRAYELILADRGGEPVPISEESPVREGRYPLRDLLPGLGEHYDKLDVEPGYLARGGTALRLAMIYGEHDGQRREEFILRRVRAGRPRIPIGAGTSLDTRCYVGDVASAVLAALDHPEAAAGQVFNVGDPVTDTVRDYAVRILADEVCSTEKMISYCKNSDAEAFVIVTESGMLHRLRREIPNKTFIPGPTDQCACADCRYMKMNTLEKLHASLLNLEPEIIIPEPIRARAELPIRRMLELSA